MMNARSAKAKGARFENHLQEVFRQTIDANTHVNKGSGAGLNKGDIRIPSLNIVVEAKNQKTISLIDWWEQAREQSLGDDIPILAIRNPRKAEFVETLIVMDLGTFTEMASGRADAETKFILSYQDRRLLDNAVRANREMLNRFGDL